MRTILGTPRPYTCHINHCHGLIVHFVCSDGHLNSNVKLQYQNFSKSLRFMVTFEKFTENYHILYLLIVFFLISVYLTNSVILKVYQEYN